MDWTIFDRITKQWFVETLKQPTVVQEQAWPAIARGEDTLVSAPTGMGKTLTAFLIFLDQLKKMARKGELKAELQVIYISPLKSLATDIRENLKKPLEGIENIEQAQNVKSQSIQIGIRTGDTTQKERQQMIKHPPHILITTPESLYLLLTSKNGSNMLRTARVMILDELHVMIDSKRGAHLMLSIARLDALCKRPLQRIGLSATIRPLETAAAYLSPEPVTIIAPKLKKEMRIQVLSPKDLECGINKKPIWEEIAAFVYEECKKTTSVIAFVEGRRFAEKLAYYVNELGGEGFARTHHGSMSKEQRQGVEQALRNGELHLLCATSSMELGIDVGDIDCVFQIGCPFTVSSMMQRLGRAGHNPNRISVMEMLPRADVEGLYCGITAEAARRGAVELLRPPSLCLDVLAQHLVSMAVTCEYCVEDVVPLLKRAYPFTIVTREDVISVLEMLAGDYEHNREIPVRPRLIYDRIHGTVSGDAYSKMLAVATSGVIPDLGMYAVRSEDGVKLGELDEEFVFEARVGERFLLGTFSWKIIRIEKDSVVVSPANTFNAKLPFWKGNRKGRSLTTGLVFGELFRELSQAEQEEKLYEKLCEFGFDDTTAKAAEAFLKRQLEATKVLPDDKTIVVEHLKDPNGNHEVMIHSMFGRQINEPLAILTLECVKKLTSRNVTHIDDDDGFLLFPYDGLPLPEGLLYLISPITAQKQLEAAVLATPSFHMAFRYNLASALMMGVRKAGRQPLWVQRMKSTDMLNFVIGIPNHPLIRETKRECLEDFWDLPGVIQTIQKIHTHEIQVVEVHSEYASPMSLPLRQQTEGAMMYDYNPSTLAIQMTSKEELDQATMIAPKEEQLKLVSERQKLPANSQELHTLLMIEGDLMAGELLVPVEWMEELSNLGQIIYIEPGLWIATEQKEQYESALNGQSDTNQELAAIIRKALRYRGGHTRNQLQDRYQISEIRLKSVLDDLIQEKQVILQEGVYYHAQLYQRAQKETIKCMRQQAITVPASHYAAYMMSNSMIEQTRKEQMEQVLSQLCDQAFPIAWWEEFIFPPRIKGYRPEYLDEALAKGNFYWRIQEGKFLSFHRYEQMDWDQEMETATLLSKEEKAIYDTLKKRGASFMQSLQNVLPGKSPHETLLALAGKGMLHADSFIPIRQFLQQDKWRKSNLNMMITARVQALTAGRWEVSRPQLPQTVEQILLQQFEKVKVLCRETIEGISWQQAVEVLRIWEYTGRARRGYFVQGLSGIQFIKSEEYDLVQWNLLHPAERIVWINAVDPCQIWGKVLKLPEDKKFIHVATNYVCLVHGEVVAALERSGQGLTIYSSDSIKEVLKELLTAFDQKRLLSKQTRIQLKFYPEEYENELIQAGFRKEIQELVYNRR